MSAEKISEIDARVKSVERLTADLIVEMKEDRAATRQNTEAMIKLTSEMSTQNKIQENLVVEFKEMRKTLNDVVTRVSVIESSAKGSDRVKYAAISTVIGLIITGALYSFFTKGG